MGGRGIKETQMLVFLLGGGGGGGMDFGFTLGVQDRTLIVLAVEV